jgi:hypothetical protein
LEIAGAVFQDNREARLSQVDGAEGTISTIANALRDPETEPFKTSDTASRCTHVASCRKCRFDQVSLVWDMPDLLIEISENYILVVVVELGRHRLQREDIELLKSLHKDYILVANFCNNPASVEAYLQQHTDIPKPSKTIFVPTLDDVNDMRELLKDLLL